MHRLTGFCSILLFLGALLGGACTPEPEFHTPAGTQRTGGEQGENSRIPLGQPDTFAEVADEDPEDTGDEPATDEGAVVGADCTPSLLVDCGT